MTRRITYANQLALSLFALQDQKEAMIELAQLTGAVLGTSTLMYGFNCTPTSPTSLAVNLGPGVLFSNQNIDNTTFGSPPSTIAPDTADQIQKLAYTLNPAQVTPFTPPATSGFSRNDLIELTFLEADGNPQSIPFFNGAGIPPFFQTLNVNRIDSVIVTVKAGVAAPTGTQTTPTPDGGYVGAWVVTTTQGMSAITSGNIAQYPGAPFITESLTQKISQATADARYARLTQFNFKNGVINGNMIVAQRQASQALANNTPLIGTVDAMYGVVNASSFSSATLTQATGLSWGSTGTALQFTNCSFTTGTVTMYHRIEALDAVTYGSDFASCGLIVQQDTGGTINYTITISQPTALNNFTSLTTIATSSSIPVVSGTPTLISFPNVAMGTITNGIQITVTATVASASSNNFWFTDLILNIGSTLNQFTPLEYAQTRQQCLRRYWQTYADGVATGTATTAGQYTMLASSGTPGVFLTVPYPVQMISAPTITYYSPSTGASGQMHRSDGPDQTGSIAWETNTSFSATCSAFQSGDLYNFQFTAEADI